MTFTAYIYVLCDPETGFVRYVGKTFNPRVRFNSHKNDKSPSYKLNWIKSLKSRGLLPTLDIIEEVQCETDADWETAERFWIETLRFIGCNLTNKDGGGNSGKRLSLEVRAKISAAHRGKKLTPEHIAKLCGRKQTKEHRRKVSEALRRRSPIIRAQAVAKTRGRKRRPEEIAGSVKARLGLTFSQEWRDNLSRAHKGNRQSDESRRKISETLKRRIADGELKRDMTIPLKARLNKSTQTTNNA